MKKKKWQNPPGSHVFYLPLHIHIQMSGKHSIKLYNKEWGLKIKRQPQFCKWPEATCQGEHEITGSENPDADTNVVSCMII